MKKYLTELFSKTFLEAEENSLAFMQMNENRVNRKLLLICIYTAFSLTCIHYFQDTSFAFGFLRNMGAGRLSGYLEMQLFHSLHARLWRLAWWAVLIILFYFVIPALLILYGFRERLGDYGLRIRGAFSNMWLYLAMLLFMVPLVVYFSGTKSFQARYPFYELQTGESLSGDFLIWELLYFFQFFSLEFFFRGFMLHGFKQRFGFYSIFIMTIPYCMIHFGKPMPETLAAIIAGVVLGVLSLKSRSILPGVLIHCSVALTMDICALWQKGFLSY